MEPLPDEVRLRTLALFHLVRKKLTGYDRGLQNHAVDGQLQTDPSLKEGSLKVHLILQYQKKGHAMKLIGD